MCNVDHDYADKGAIESGISYIRGLSGQPTAEANKCNRVSCSWGSGIYLCADVSITGNIVYSTYKREWVINYVIGRQGSHTAELGSLGGCHTGSARQLWKRLRSQRTTDA
mgnify:FL=1|jgi:hypothetical protein